VFIIKRSIKITGLLTALSMVIGLAGCSIEKEVIDPTTNAAITELTVKPGTYKDVTYNIVVKDDRTEEGYPQETLARYSSEGETAEEEPTQEDERLRERIIFDRPRGFVFSLISLNGTVLDTPKEIGEDGIIFDLHHEAIPEYNVTYTLRIENRQQEEYEADPTPEALMRLFNQQYNFATETYFDLIGIDEPTPTAAAVYKGEGSEETTEIPQTKIREIIINTGAPGKISPTLEYVEAEGDTFTAHWGYYNDNNFKITLPDENSKITSGTVIGDEKPPIVFEKGRVRDVYTPSFSSGVLVWNIKGPDGKGRTSTASGPIMDASIEADKEQVKVGDRINYTVTITNPTAGEQPTLTASTKSNVVVFNDIKLTNTVMNGIKVLGAVGAEDCYMFDEQNEFLCMLGSLSGGETKKIKILCEVLPSFSGDKVVDKVKIEFTVNGALKIINLQESTDFIAEVPEPPVVVSLPDISLTVNGKEKAKPGEELEYKFAVENVGDASVTDLKIVTALPAGTSFMENSSAAWSLENGKYVYTVGDLFVQNKKEVIFKVRVNSPFTVSESKLVVQGEAKSFYAEDYYGNNTAKYETLVEDVTAPEVPEKIDVKLDVTGADKVKEGKEVEYKFTIENIGSSEGKDIKLYVGLPKGTSISEDPATLWKLEGGKYVYFIGELLPLEKREVLFKVKVNAPFTESGNSLVLIGEVNGDFVEVDVNNNTAKVETLVEVEPQILPQPGEPDLPMTGGIVEIEMLAAFLGAALIAAGFIMKRSRKQTR
jgi:uncharacterized repeat protein (TIGR01451 family)